MRCHICGNMGGEFTVKCKLCCDGVEHEYCRACADDEYEFKRNLDAPNGKAAFRRLQERRAEWRKRSA